MTVIYNNDKLMSSESSLYLWLVYSLKYNQKCTQKYTRVCVHQKSVHVCEYFSIELDTILLQ